MSMIDALKDIIKHTNSLGFIDAVKIVGTAADAKLEAMDADKTVVIYGTMYQPINGIDTTVGLSRLSMLKGWIDFPGFSEDKSSVVIVTEPRLGVTIPTGIKFSDGAGHTSDYRFMGEQMINEQIKVPTFKGATWNITISPEKKKISNLTYCQGVIGGFEKRFTVSVDNGTLYFNIGTGPTDKTAMPFATNVTGSLKHQWSWPLSQILGILKLSETAASTTMKFSDGGALMIEIDSGIGKYSYILPAGKA